MSLVSLDELAKKYNIPGLLVDIDQLETGDVLLYGGTGFLPSRLVRWWSKSQWSHVSLVLKDPTFIDPVLTGTYILESGGESFKDAEDHEYKLGVQINSLEELLQTGYDGYICYRKLKTNIPKEVIEERLKEVHQIVHNCPYDTNIYDLLIANSSIKDIEAKESNLGWFWNWMKPRHRRGDTYFCSALVGFVYTQLGLLPEQTRWTECQPKFFSSIENPDMILTPGSALETDTLIYQNPKCKTTLLKN